MSGGRTVRDATVLAALGFTGVLVLLPNPIRRRMLAKVDAVTDDIVRAATAAWEET